MGAMHFFGQAPSPVTGMVTGLSVQIILWAREAGASASGTFFLLSFHNLTGALQSWMRT